LFGDHEETAESARKIQETLPHDWVNFNQTHLHFFQNLQVAADRITCYCYSNSLQCNNYKQTKANPNKQHFYSTPHSNKYGQSALTEADGLKG